MNSQSFHPRVVMPQNGQMPNPMMGNIQYVAMPWDGSTPYQPNPFMPFGSYFIPMMPPSQTQMYPPSPENPQGFVQMPMFHLPMPYPPPVRPPPQFIPKKNLNNPSN
uniref:Uncharacterized protein n=1 Tax=Panagrolaimus sp. JU765 TaxID=591449 RepID=A0AC34R188_9BILA